MPELPARAARAGRAPGAGGRAGGAERAVSAATLRHQTLPSDADNLTISLSQTNTRLSRLTQTVAANRALLTRAGRERPEAHRLRVRPDRLGQDVHDGGGVQRGDWSSAGLDGGATAAAGAGLPGDDTLRDLRREVLREPNHHCTQLFSCHRAMPCKAVQNAVQNVLRFAQASDD